VAFDSRTFPAGVELSVAPVTLLTTTIVHPCPGPIYLEAVVLAFLSPTGPDRAVATLSAGLTCTGDGCEVTGDVVHPDGPGTGSLTEDTADVIASVALSAVFAEVPAGTYDVDVLASGRLAGVLRGEAHVVSRGTPSGGARSP
jgi:hypothetical protein